jgi:hypothetical protein
MHNQTLLKGARSLGMVAVACSGACEDATPDDAVATRSEQLNGIRLNGIRLNGIRLNGIRLNGTPLNGGDPSEYIEVLGIALKGQATGTASWLVGSQLHVQSSSGPVLSGAGLDKATIEFDVLETGKGKKFKTVKFEGYGLLAPGSDVATFSLKLKDGGWHSLCENNTDVILLGDLWDPASGDRITAPPADALTFACRGDALAKCVEEGYRPWASVAGTSLRDHHQACTRMLRADYCGDGIPHTSDGTPIHVLDALGIQTAEPGVDYVVEAEWGPDGATCLNAANTRLPGVVVDCGLPACGASFASGGLIQSGKVLAP